MLTAMAEMEVSIGSVEPTIVQRVLKSLDEAGVRYAILHGADRVRSGRVESDLDIAVGIDPKRLLGRITPTLRGSGLHPILEWQYDVGGTLTVFIANRDGSEAMQLDMLWDVNGIGRYAVKSDVILERASISDGLPVVRPVDEVVYLLRKRAEKQNSGELARLRERAQAFDTATIEDSIGALLTSSGRYAVRSALQGRSGRVRFRPVRALATMFRLLRRLNDSAAYWVVLSGATPAEQIRMRFGYLPNNVTVLEEGQKPLRRMARRRLAQLKPGLVMSVGSPAIGRPDLDLSATAGPGLFEELVAGMNQRTESRLDIS